TAGGERGVATASGLVLCARQRSWPRARPGCLPVAMACAGHEHAKKTCGLLLRPPPLTAGSWCSGGVPGGGDMHVVYERCAGIDVHKKTVVVTVRSTSTASKTTKTTRTDSTMTGELRALAAWLDQEHVEQVAMESTGVSWWPIYNLLEERHPVTLVNPQ